MYIKDNKSKKKKKKVITISIVVGLLILVAIGAPSIFKGTITYKFNETNATKGTIETYYTFSGSVVSKNTQMVMAEKIMQISEVKVSEGEKIKKDGILFKTSDGTEIKAKIDGTISKIHVTKDQQVMGGAQLCDIYDFGNLQVSVKVDESDISCISINRKIDVTISALNKTISGNISKISDTAINQNGVAYFTSIIDLEKDNLIKVGMTAEAKLLNKQSKDVITLPLKAVQFNDNDEPYVYIMSQENGNDKMPIQKSIEIGLNDGKTVEIKSGLIDGQKVLYPKPSTATTGGFVPPIPKV